MKTGVCLTALDDLVLDIATFGLYNLLKGVRQARRTVRQTGTAVEGITDGIGTSAAAAGTAMAQMAGDLMLFARELEELVTIRGPTPRSENDLLDAEVERLRALRVREKELLDELAEQGVDIKTAGAWSDIFLGNFPGEAPGSREEILALSKLSIVQNAIDEMLYAEPGVVPACLYGVEEALKRFNTLEQAGIEEVLAATQNTLEESEAVLKEVENLFVVRRWRPVDAASLSREDQEELARLQSSLKLYEQLIERNSRVLIRLQEELLHAHPEEWTGIYGAEPLGTMDDPEGERLTGEAERTGTNPPYAEGPAGPGLVTHIPGKLMPKGARIARSLHRNDISAHLENHAAFLGINRYYERERLKAEKKIALLTRVPVEEPGVVPGVLEETRQSIARFRIEEQPRVESLLDNLNLMLVETRGVTARTDRTLEKIEVFSDLISDNRLLITIGGAVFVGLVAVILVLILILLVRLTLML